MKSLLSSALMGIAGSPCFPSHGATIHVAGGNGLENGFIQHIQAGCLQRFISKDATRICPSWFSDAMAPKKAMEMA